MDRRQKKTREAIFSAFGKLLQKKRYESITVQENIDEANIGRSTFYAHFETKDELLRSMCTEIFHHVFYQNHMPEGQGPEPGGRRELEMKLAHVLYHLREHQQELTGLLRSESAELFLQFFKGYLYELFRQYMDAFQVAVPEHFLLHHLVGSFSEALKWWVEEEMRHSPEEVTGYFMAVLRL